MTEPFDDLARAMSRRSSRRGALKIFGATAAATAGAMLLKPFRGGAVTCPAGSQFCGQGCCLNGGTCSDPASSCCCPKGTAPCGRTCCQSGVACIDRTNGLCGCPAGTTPCGTGANLTCCPAGQACRPGCPSASSFNTASACVSGTTSTSTSTSTSTTVCTPSGGPCTFANPGACCSFTCFCPGAACPPTQT